MRTTEEPPGLLGGLFGTPAVLAAVGDRAVIDGMLAAEAALAGALADVGIATAGAARAVEAVCRAARPDPDALGRAALAAGNPVPPLVRELSAALAATPGPDAIAARSVLHRGATSQDVLDTALVLCARAAVAGVLADLDAVAARCAGLAGGHRDTPMAGRTLLQQAVPTTFGAKAAGWLVGVLDARAGLAAAAAGLPAQLGGAAGTLGPLGGDGAEVLDAYARRLALPAPVVPWHTIRTPVTTLAGALGTAAALLGKVATDVVLLAQTEVAEVAEGSGGGSSAMPHKRNPVGAVLTRACATRAPGLVATLLAAADQEHERAAGGWHAEWEPLRALLTVTAGAAGHLRAVLTGLTVDPARMRTDLDLTGGLLLSEGVAGGLTGALGRNAAQDLVAAAAGTASTTGRPFRDVLLADPAVAKVLSAADLDALLDPGAYLGSAGAFVDRALARYAADAPEPS